MLLNGTLTGILAFDENYTGETVDVYDTVEVFGESKIDKVRALNIDLTETQANELRYTDEYAWIPDMLMYGEFDNTLYAGNIEGIVNPITTWEIYRKETTESTYSLLTVLDVLIEDYTDYTPRANRSYDYRIFAKNDVEISTPIDADPIITDWYHWALVDADDGTVYLFDLDLVSDQITRTQNITHYDSSFSKYTPTTYGQQDYISGSISATAGSIDCTQPDTLNFSVDMLEELGDFINNKKNKILKSRYGDAWVVSTSDFSYKFNDVITRQIATINFSFRQIDDL